MTTRQRVSRSCLFACMFAAMASVAAAQGRGAPPGQTVAFVSSDPLVGPVVRDAPYSGEAITTVTQILGDGTRIERTTTAKFYRDSAGRGRREQTIMGLDGLNPSNDAQTVITIHPVPDDAFAYVLDPTMRTARRVPRGLSGAPVVSWALATQRSTFSLNGRPYALQGQTLIGPQQVPEGIRPVEGSLGTRQIEGVKAIGRRTTSTIPTGQIGNDRPIEITDERWESPELKVLLLSRHHDPRTGDVEYRLTNLSRSEPPPDLFTVPSDYTIIGPGEPGGRSRGGGPGGRGQQP